MTTSEQHNTMPPIVHLKFEKGETIIKEGDYGISIYQVIDGKVEIFVGSGKEETRLAILKPGEIMGEMIFLTGNKARRSASARALSYTVLAAWHPARIEKEYDEMPFMMKHIANLTVRRLQRINKMITELEAIKAKEKEEKEHDPWLSHRQFYRKATDFECMYREVNSPQKLKLYGQIKDISMSGLRLQVKKENSFKCSHEPGNKFIVSTFLPTGKRLNVQIKIVRHVKIPDKTQLSLGALFVDLSRIARQTLGFFLMP